MREDKAGEKRGRRARGARGPRSFQPSVRLRPSVSGSSALRQAQGIPSLSRDERLALRSHLSRGPQQQPFVQAPGAVTLQIEADVAVPGGLELADNRGADLGV